MGVLCRRSNRGSIRWVFKEGRSWMCDLGRDPMDGCSGKVSHAILPCWHPILLYIRLQLTVERVWMLIEQHALCVINLDCLHRPMQQSWLLRVFSDCYTVFTRWLYECQWVTGHGLLLVSYQVHKNAGCACARNAGNVFHRGLAMLHGTCVTHIPWCIPRWHSRRMRKLQFYVSGMRPIAGWCQPFDWLIQI